MTDINKPSHHAEYIEHDGDVWSWYCSDCLQELGADLSQRDGQPVNGCPEHGIESLAWELWNGEI